MKSSEWTRGRLPSFLIKFCLFLFVLANNAKVISSSPKLNKTKNIPIIGESLSRGETEDLIFKTTNTTLVLDETLNSRHQESSQSNTYASLPLPPQSPLTEDIEIKFPSSEVEVVPTVFIALLIRNKAHTLPYFLTLLEGLDYPKERIALWIRSDHNEDTTAEILTKWSRKIDNQGTYHSISSQIVDSPPFRQSDQGNFPIKWTQKRFRHVIRLKEEALKIAKKIWADYILFLDADAFLLNNQTLKHLISKRKRIVAPMLISGSLYSNFWGGMEKFYYKRTDSYQDIFYHRTVGCFEVPMVHTAILINLQYVNVPNFLRSNDTIPEDDIIVFALNAKERGIPMEICNDLDFGATVAPLPEESDLMRDEEQLLNLKAEIAAYWYPALTVSEDLKQWAQGDPVASPVGFDQVYLINLKRRPDRLARMTNVLKVLGIDYHVLEGTDGNTMTPENLTDLGIHTLPSYRDPYSKRVMTFGEIGCFLSHYRVWEDMLKNHHQTALILEDDIRFEPYFVFQLQRIFEEAGKIKLDWDLMYLGRKKSKDAKEPPVPGTEFIVKADYSYWTLGYAITRRGVKKMMEAKPLERLVPIDEMFPIMFDRHFNEWMSAFPIRNLLAFSAEPLLLYPTHYTGEIGYVSDTEQSNLHDQKHNQSKEEL